MFDLSGYVSGIEVDTADDQLDFSVNSCGHYKLLARPRFDTARPAGRADFQILYMAGGKGHFRLDGAERPAVAGQLVLYRPGQPQIYRYLCQDAPDVYWLHFTGRNAATLLDCLGFGEGMLFEVHGFSGRYAALFDQIIQELQHKEENFLQMASLLGQQLLALLGRGLHAFGLGDPVRQRIQEAVARMYQDYRLPLSTQDYSDWLRVGKCWFIRSFKAVTGVPPLHYLTEIRINRSKELLESSPYNIGEIADMVGYDNPLYFSRLFKRKTGLSPLQYRKKRRR